MSILSKILMTVFGLLLPFASIAEVSVNKELSAQAIILEEKSTSRSKAEAIFKEECLRVKTHLQTLLRRGLITAEELTRGQELVSTYQQGLPLYLDSLQELRELEGDERYSYYLEYLSGHLNMLVMNPNARLDEITPEVMDYVPARDLCSNVQGPAQDECVAQELQNREQQVYANIREIGHTNEQDFIAAARLGLSLGRLYGDLVGLVHHQSENLRRSEILDVQDRLISSINQDINEGY